MSASAPHIESIRLSGVVPEVFAAEGVAVRSEVWLSDVEFPRGCRVVVEAASGTGKSSLCSYIYGARTDFRGEISFDIAGEGRADARALDMERWQTLRRYSLAYLPQDLALFPKLSAIENILLKDGLTDAVGTERIEHWLGMLGLSARRDFPVGKMSLGQQQRVALIRALCQPFDILLLDEPVSHLDEANNRIAASIVEERAAETGGGVIATSVGNRLLLPQFTTLIL